MRGVFEEFMREQKGNLTDVVTCFGVPDTDMSVEELRFCLRYSQHEKSRSPGIVEKLAAGRSTSN